MTTNLPNTGKKPWYTSKTVWFNIFVLLLTLVLYVLEGITKGDVKLPGGIDPEWLLFLQGIGNLILRFMTMKALRR